MSEEEPKIQPISLTASEKVARFYGIWWDIVNTATVVLVLTSIFLVFSLVLIAGRTELLPWGDTLWRQFVAEVPLDRQSEIGLAMLGVTVSGATAAGLYIVRVGTTRWTTNRRVGQSLRFFAGHFLSQFTRAYWPKEVEMKSVDALMSYLLTVHQEISETHPRVQELFESTRVLCYLSDTEEGSTKLRLEQIVVNLFAAALICEKCVAIQGVGVDFAARIREAAMKSKR
jgi:hypothetical protein